ncbi:MAG: hypothetical protein Q7R80_03655 [bacterium]|nr:hypothetical protein [bacterium]
MYCPRCWRRYRAPGTCTDCSVALEEPTNHDVRIELVRRISNEALEAASACRSRGHRRPCTRCAAITMRAIMEVRKLLPTPN